MSEVVSEQKPGFRIERISLSSRALRPDAPPVRFVQLSDLHLSRLRPRHAGMVECVNEWEPDFICLTGDLVTLKDASWDVLAALAGRLHARRGAFACIGNWEIKTRRRHEAMRRFGEACGLTFLVNESRTVATDAGTVRLCGVDDLALGWPVWDDALAENAEADYTVVMAHAPVAAHMVRPEMGVDLVLSGHTHGGQIRLPVVWRLFLPGCHGGMVAGLYPMDWGLVYVNRGFGAAPRLPLRFMCPPEVAFLTLVGE